MKMKISAFLVVCMVLVSSVMAQAPDYSRLDPKPFDPETDPDIGMYMGSWKESMPKHTHGSLVERDILTVGDPLHPPYKGAVLKYVNRFTYAALEAHASTVPTILDGEQEIFYILSGVGTIATKTQTADLHSGIAVLMPADCEFIIRNIGESPLTMYLIAEPFPEGFRLNRDMIVVNENTTPVSSSTAHWVGIVKPLFNTQDGLGTLESILTCQFDPMTFFHPHSHGEGTEEVWATITGEVYVLLGKQIRHQPPGTAYMIPADGKTPHANFNVSDSMVNMFYFARYRDHELRK